MPSDSKTSPRIAPVAPGTRPELAELEARIRGARGRVSPLYQVLLNSPRLAAGWEHLFTVIRQQTSVPARLRELVILRIAVLNGADYEFQAHVPHALQAGMAQEAIDALKKNAAVLEGVDQLVIRYTDALTRELNAPDELFDELRKHFDDKTLVELTATIAGYNMVSRFLIAMRIH
ncbi:MAG TPA: carboxymuconolactone decarboxylase family protein [Burkholderiales bacterium]